MNNENVSQVLTKTLNRFQTYVNNVWGTLVLQNGIAPKSIIVRTKIAVSEAG